MSDKSDLLVAAEVLEREFYDSCWWIQIEPVIRQLRQRQKSVQPRPIDWGDPEILKKLQFDHGGKHVFIEVLTYKAPGEWPVKIMAENGTLWEYKLSGKGLSHHPLIPITPKVVRKTVYVSLYGTKVLEANVALSGNPVFKMNKDETFDTPVTIEFEVPND